MASPEVKVSIVGDASSFSRAAQQASDDAKQLDSKLNKLGETGGTTETRFLGLGAGISGVSTLMSGDAGPEQYAMAMADLGDAVEHTIAPLLSQGRALVASGLNAVTSAAQHAASAATVVAGWVAMGVQATINAAKMAAAWLISLGPVGLVIAAIGGIIAVLVAMGVGFDDVAAVAQAAWDLIVGAAQFVFNWLKDNWPLVLAILTGPFGLAALAIVKNWDTIKDAATSAKDWIAARVGDIVAFITSIPGRIAGAITDMAGKGAELGTAFINGVKGAITGAAGFAADIAGGIVSAVKSAWNSFARTINDLIPNSIGWGPASIDLPDNPIPRFARGGIVTRPTLAIIGEAGPEAVVPLTRPMPAPVGMWAGGGGVGGTVVNYYMTFQGPTNDRQVIESIKRFERSNGSGWRRRE